MEKLKHYYSNVYYSDLDVPTQELHHLEQFLSENVNLNNLSLVSVKPLSKEVLISHYKGEVASLINYAFIRSDLAGVGNYNFIVEYTQPLQAGKIIHIVKKHLVKNFFQNKFFANKWIDELINEDIAVAVLITYCDGIWVELFKT